LELYIRQRRTLNAWAACERFWRPDVAVDVSDVFKSDAYGMKHHARNLEKRSRHVHIDCKF